MIQCPSGETTKFKTLYNIAIMWSSYCCEVRRQPESRWQAAHWQAELVPWPGDSGYSDRDWRPRRPVTVPFPLAPRRFRPTPGPLSGCCQCVTAPGRAAISKVGGAYICQICNICTYAYFCIFLHILAYLFCIYVHTSIRCISGAYQVHIRCIFLAYFVHISCIFVHIYCI